MRADGVRETGFIAASIRSFDGCYFTGTFFYWVVHTKADAVAFERTLCFAFHVYFNCIFFSCNRDAALVIYVMQPVRSRITYLKTVIICLYRFILYRVWRRTPLFIPNGSIYHA